MATTAGGERAFQTGTSARFAKWEHVMFDLGKLTAIVGPSGVLGPEEAAGRFANLGNPLPQRARAIVRPRNTSELARIVALCAEARQPICVQGGKSGGSGSESEGDEIAISLERMAAVEIVDPVSRTATVQAGCLLENLQATVNRHGLYYGVDYGGRGSATLGGNISTNAGGLTVMRYGMTREQILGLEVVLANGTVLSSMNPMLKDNAGYDLKHLFIGSEGTLGIVARAVVRLRPMMASEDCGFFAFEEFAGVERFLAYCEKAFGETLTCFEVMWRDHYAVASEGKDVPLPHGHAFYVIVETRGPDAEVDGPRFERAMLAAFEDGAIVDGVLPKSQGERQAIWDIREDLDWLMRRDWLVFDISLGIAFMDSYVTELRAQLLARWPAAELWVFGHIADGNLHIFISPGVEAATVREEVSRLVYAPLQSVGGSMAAEHGVGKDKVPYLHYSRGPEELALMVDLKRVMDPGNILNPGRVVPRW